ncbi:MAG: fibronectin type III domain-containing protein [bacterium]|nr:fibronectin type III domain-containing protein [bacterium]
MSQIIVRTVRKEPPSAPSLNLSLHQDGRHCNIDWSPGTGGGAVTSFEVEVNRPLPAPSWQSNTLSFESEMLSTRNCGRVGTDYYVKVRAKNEYGTSADTEGRITIPGPRLTIRYHGWDLWGLDSDAEISWDPVWGESAEYQLDWRYIDKNDTVVDHKIDKKSKPNDSNKPEIVYTWDRVKVNVKLGRDYYYTGWRYKDLRKKNPKYARCDKDFKSDPCSPKPKDNIKVQIEEVERDYVLQVRVGDRSQVKWTPWYYDQLAFLNVKCKSYRIYNKIKGILEKIDLISDLLVVGGVAAAVFTGGAASVASVGVKAAAKEFAKNAVKKLLTKKVFKEYISHRIGEILKKTLAKSSLEVASIALLVACIFNAQSNNDDSFEIEAASEFAAQLIEDSEIGRTLEDEFRKDLIMSVIVEIGNI